jgi:hypothetical protein
MNKAVSLPGERSVNFSGTVGRTIPASELSADDYLMDSSRFSSEGHWGFCRFPEGRIRAARLGFQKGSFNITEKQMDDDPSLLQLHLELITSEGAVLWLPTGVYSGADVVQEAPADSTGFSITFDPSGNEIFSIRGWPDMRWHFRSEDRDLEMDLRFSMGTVTVLPDCILPYSVFSMWESMSNLDGSIRYKTDTRPVSGKMFYDHTRVSRPEASSTNLVTPREMYIYTTMFFEDGSGIFGYHAENLQGRPIEYYCFGVYVDREGRGHFLPQARLRDLRTDDDDLPEQWSLEWRNEDVRISCGITVERTEIARSWGSPDTPQSRREFSILPLVLNGSASVTESSGGAVNRGAASGTQKSRTIKGYGLAEYFNKTLWFGK